MLECALCLKVGGVEDFDEPQLAGSQRGRCLEVNFRPLAAVCQRTVHLLLAKLHNLTTKKLQTRTTVAPFTKSYHSWASSSDWSVPFPFSCGFGPALRGTSVSKNPRVSPNSAPQVSHKSASQSFLPKRPARMPCGKSVLQNCHSRTRAAQDCFARVSQIIVLHKCIARMFGQPESECLTHMSRSSYKSA